MSKVTIFTKNDRFSSDAVQLARVILDEDIRHINAGNHKVMPTDIVIGSREIVLSFLWPWVIPNDILRTSPLAINFHPGSSDYPGTGCYNFALYEDAREYGAVCHFMAETVDTGSIIEERRFPVFAQDTIETLKLRTLVTMLSMFHDIVSRIAQGWTPQDSGILWSRKPFTRAQLNRLGTIDAAMPDEEVERRIRATTYPGYPGACATIGGRRFFSPVPDRPPLA